MDLVQIHVIHPQPAQRVLARLDDVLAAQAARDSGPCPWPVDFGRHHDIVARRHLPQMQPGDLLAQPDRVNVRGVEEIDPGIERDVEMLARIFFVDVPALRAQRPIRHFAAAITHASQAEPRNRDSGLAESLVLHRPRL